MKQVSSNYDNVKRRWLVMLSDLGEQRKNAKSQKYLEKYLNRDKKALAFN